MPFEVPAIYFRTPTTTSTITSDPSDLPPEQILLFSSDSNTIIELVDDVYQNNISIDPAINPDGTKKVFLQDNGRLEDIITITGKILSSDSAFVKKFRTFSRKLQIDTFHKFGIIGLAYPKTDSFSIDPDATVGLFIDKLQLTTSGQKKSQIPFILTLKVGGTLS